MTLDNLDSIKNVLNECLTFINNYNWLLNSYVLDFYVDDHWNKLPKSWQIFFYNISSTNLAKILNYNEKTEKNSVWPLSILAIQSLLGKISLQRTNMRQKDGFINDRKFIFEHPKLKTLFFKHVKPKKQHEIIQMSEICYKTSKQSNVNYIVDFGAGLGHLSRVLAYGYGFNVCCLEQQLNLTEQARAIDRKLELTALKYLTNNGCKDFKRPVHLNMKLARETKTGEFIKEIKNAFNLTEKDDNNFEVGVVGLHPCGDLASILLKLFKNCKEIKFINIVGCCYMKLTISPLDSSDQFIGYPLSNFLNCDLKSFSNLSYESLEIACHAIEMYASRLASENYEHLKIHSYRAAIEQIIIKYWPELKHSGLKSVKHKNILFSDYCKSSTSNLNIEIPIEEYESEEMRNNLDGWKNVVIFYTLRLMLAPIVETVVLLDRLLYLKENGIYCKLDAIFDPNISPRNHILTGVKK